MSDYENPKEVVEVFILASPDIGSKFDSHYRTVLARARSERLRQRTQELWPDQVLPPVQALETHDIKGLMMHALVCKKDDTWVYTLGANFDVEELWSKYFIGLHTILALAELWHMPLLRNGEAALDIVYKRTDSGRCVTMARAVLDPEVVEEFKLDGEH